MNPKIFLVLLIILVFFFFLDFRLYSFDYGENWYPEEKYGTVNFRWIPQIATLYITNDAKLPQKVEMNFVAWSYNHNRELEIELGNSTTKLNVSQYPSTNKLVLNLRPGKNILSFSSSECTIINSTCISIAIGNLYFS